MEHPTEPQPTFALTSAPPTPPWRSQRLFAMRGRDALVCFDGVGESVNAFHELNPASTRAEVFSHLAMLFEEIERSSSLSADASVAHRVLAPETVHKTSKLEATAHAAFARVNA